MSDVVTPRPITVSEHALLRACSREDAESLFALVDENREFLRRWLPWVDATTRVEDELNFVRAAQSGYVDAASPQLALEVDGRLAGSCGFVEINRTNRSAEIGYWLAEANTGHGHMTAGYRALVEHGFAALELHRTVIRAATENAPSRAVDLARYAVLSGEWAERVA